MNRIALAAAALCIASSAYAGPAVAPPRLTVTTEAPVVECKPDGTGASVLVSYLVTSSGAADSALVTATVNGTNTLALPTIASGNVVDGGGWTFAGRYKTAEGSYADELPNGEYLLVVCAEQSGSDKKYACSLSTTITVACTSTDPCASASAFGEIPGNKSLCNGNGNLQVQFEGAFGLTATLQISGPNGFTRTVSVPRNGDSCNYHYNWDPQAIVDSQVNNGGAGTYTLTASGGAASPYAWPAKLDDCTPNGNGGGNGGNN